MSAPLLWRHLAELQSAPMSAITLAAAGSFAGQIMAVIQGAPLWVYLLAALAPWLPIFALEVVWTYRHYKWVAIFCVLDLQRVHTLWAIWGFLAILLLATRFPRNFWLWPCLAIAGFDAVQHLGILIPLGVRAELELGVSVVEFATLAMAFIWQVGRTYDAWLARAFPNLPEHVLIETTTQLEELRLRPGERIKPNGGRWYIVTRGTGSLIRGGPGGHDILLRVLSPGQVVRGDGTLCADSALEVLALPAVFG